MSKEAKDRATCNWTGASEVKLDRRNQPVAVVLSPPTRIQDSRGTLVCSNSMATPTKEAKNSRELRDVRLRYCCGISQRHRNLLVMFIPPMPCSQESVSIIISGIRRVRRLRLMPVEACFRNCCHSCKSARWSVVRMPDRFRLARYIAARIRPKKWRAHGIMKPAWFSRPMSVSNGPWHARGAASKSVMLRDHAMYLCIGRDINRLRELITHPNTVLISAGVASAKNFFSERTSSRDMDSSWCNGRPRR
jgi:hypothetical protein